MQHEEPWRDKVLLAQDHSLHYRDGSDKGVLGNEGINI
jgi:hypothetical protein